MTGGRGRAGRIALLGLATLAAAAPARAEWRGGLAWWIEARRRASAPTVLVADPLPRGSYRYSSGFGWRSGRRHSGLDLVAPQGTPVVAMGDGRVIESGWRRGYGHTVVVAHAEGLSTRYAHLVRPPFVRPGDEVRAGDPLGGVGATGNATTPHLHLEVLEQGEAVDPRRHFDF